MDLAVTIRARLLPFGARLAARGVSPDAATLVGLGLALGAALAISLGAPALGALLFAGSLLADGLDGAIARSSGRARPAGAILDAVVDRIGELALLAALALAADAPLLGALASGGAALPSYLRARSREAGIDALTGPLDRGGRGALMIVGLIGASLNIERSLELTLGLIAVGSLLTALRRARAIVQAFAAR
jgi:CDP-diacylglycerol--glycerol-3-phosphate 3-phosphatidyltransferase